MKVIGIGDNVVDQYEHIRTMYPGGNALNFAVYARQMGYQAAYLGIFGTDSAAAHVQDVLDRLDIDRSRCRVVDGDNGCARLKIEQGERVFLGSNEGGIRKTAPMAFIFDDLPYLKAFDLIHTGSYSYIDEQLPALRQLGIQLSYDFSDDFVLESALQLCGFLDFAFFSCADYPLEQTRAIILAASERGCRYVAATRGSEGALLYDGQRWYQQPPHYVMPVDTLGAGDSFITAFLVNFVERAHFDKHAAPENIIQFSLEQAAAFSAQTCLIEGAFGYGTRY